MPGPLKYYSPQVILEKALDVNLYKTSVASKNLAYKNVPGYVCEKVHTTDGNLGGVSSGPQISKTEQLLDKVLVEQIRRQASILGERETLDEFHQNIESLLGPKGAQASFVHDGSAMVDSLHGLLTNSLSSGKRLEVVQSIQKHVKSVTIFSNRLQDMRGKVDQHVHDSVGKINDLLMSIGDINKKLRGVTSGETESFTYLNNQRQALQNLSEMMDVYAVEDSSGGVSVFTTTGQTLIMRELSAQLSHTPTASVSPLTTLSPISIQGFGMTTDITNDFIQGNTHGSLQALVKLRDTILPGLQQQIDGYVERLRDNLNAIHNLGVSTTPPQTLLGTVGVPGLSTINGSTVFSGTGTLRVGILNPTTGGIVQKVDVALTTNMTVQNLIDAINASSNASGVTASLTTSGALQIASNNSAYGVVMGSVGSNNAQISLGSSFNASASYGVSHFFGLNNLFVTANILPGQSNAGVSNQLNLRGDILSSNGAFLSSATLTSSSTPDTLAVGSGDVSIINQMYQKYTETNVSFGGTLLSPPVQTSLKDFAMGIVDGYKTIVAENTEALKTENYYYEGLSTRAFEKSGVNQQRILQESMELSISQSMLIRALKLANEMDKYIMDVL